MRALYAAATGMAAQELNVQVISNNIANLRTTGYKRQQAAFPGSALPEPAPGRLLDLRPEHPAAGRPRHRLGREDDLDRPRHVAGHADLDREGLRRRDPRRGLLPGDACRTAAPPIPATARSTSRRTGQLVTRDGYLRRSRRSPCRNNATAVTISATGRRPGDACPGQTAPQALGPVPALALRQQGRPRIDRRQPVHRDRRPPARRSTACRARRASATCSRATSRRRTSTPSPRSRR